MLAKKVLQPTAKDNNAANHQQEAIQNELNSSQHEIHCNLAHPFLERSATLLHPVPCLCHCRMRLPKWHGLCIVARSVIVSLCSQNSFSLRTDDDCPELSFQVHGAADNCHWVGTNGN